MNMLILLVQMICSNLMYDHSYEECDVGAVDEGESNSLIKRKWGSVEVVHYFTKIHGFPRTPYSMGW